MLNISEFRETIKQEKINDQTIKSWLLEDPRLVDEKAMELLIKHRPSLSRQILKELLVKYIEKVANNKM